MGMSLSSSFCVLAARALERLGAEDRDAPLCRPGTPWAGLGGIFPESKVTTEPHSWEWAKDNVDAELPLGKPCSGWAEATRSRDDQSSLALYWDILGMLIPSPKLGVQEAFPTSLPTGNPG